MVFVFPPLLIHSGTYLSAIIVIIVTIIFIIIIVTIIFIIKTLFWVWAKVQ